MTQIYAVPAPLPVALRAYQSADEGFVVSTWVRVVSSIPGQAKRPRWEQEYFRRGVHETAERLLASGLCVLVACDVEDPGLLYGWAGSEGDCLHGWYVKPRYRAAGIGRLLLAGLPAVRAYSMAAPGHVERALSLGWRFEPGRAWAWKDPYASR